MTLLLTRSDVENLLDPYALIEALRSGFIAYSSTPGERARRVRAPLNGPGSATVLFPGTTAGLPIYTVKVHAKFPAETPAIRGVVCVHDMNTGCVLAVMDSTYLTAVRTGAAGALAADVLARTDADQVCVWSGPECRARSNCGLLPGCGICARSPSSTLTNNGPLRSPAACPPT